MLRSKKKPKNLTSKTSYEYYFCDVFNVRVSQARIQQVILKMTPVAISILTLLMLAVGNLNDIKEVSAALVLSLLPVSIF